MLALQINDLICFQHLTLSNNDCSLLDLDYNNVCITALWVLLSLGRSQNPQISKPYISIAHLKIARNTILLLRQTKPQPILIIIHWLLPLKYQKTRRVRLCIAKTVKILALSLSRTVLNISLRRKKVYHSLKRARKNKKVK